MALFAGCGLSTAKASESEVPDSWEDIAISQEQDLNSTCPSGLLPTPDEIAYGRSICVQWHWQVAYTWHAGRFESPCVHDDFGELFVAPDGGKVKAALLTSFHPFQPKFLQRLPHDADIVVCVQNRSDGAKKLPRYLFGIELENVHQMSEQARQEVYQATSTFCSHCLSADAKLGCSPRGFLRACKCQDECHRTVRWVLPQFKGRDIMHAKIMVLRFHGFVRLVVSSFNLSELQWSEAGDSFWWVDLPFCSTRNTPDKRVQLPLVDMLERLQVPPEWPELLAECDWTVIQAPHSRVHLVTSCAGVPSAAHFEYGMERLSEVLKQMPKFPASEQCPADVQVWSLGGVHDRWYTNFALTLIQERFKHLGLIAQWEHDHVRFIFQRFGRGPNWRDHFERQVAKRNRVRRLLDMDEIEPKRSALKTVLWDESRSDLLDNRRAAKPVSWGWHSKVMTREYPQGYCKREGCNRTHGWRYIGSHNCSKASWGDSMEGTPPRNFEAGVLLLSLPSSSSVGECGVDLRDVAPVPFHSITRAYPAALL